MSRRPKIIEIDYLSDIPPSHYGTWGNMYKALLGIFGHVERIPENIMLEDHLDGYEDYVFRTFYYREDVRMGAIAEILNRKTFNESEVIEMKFFVQELLSRSGVHPMDKRIKKLADLFIFLEKVSSDFNELNNGKKDARKNG